MNVRELQAGDTPNLIRILKKTKVFKEEDVEIANELLDAAVCEVDEKEYVFFVSVSEDGKQTGFVCHGKTSITDGTYDLYWLVVDPEFQRNGVGKILLDHVENSIKKENGRLIIVETSSTKEYGPARAFYRRNKYDELARIKDYYRVGDDLVIYGKYL